MNKEVWRNNDIQFLEKLSEHKVKCKCGHTMVLIDKKYTICNWCGTKVYRSKKDEFEDKIKKAIK